MEQGLFIGLGIALTLSLAGVGFLLARRVNTLAGAARSSRRALDDRLVIERERLEGLREIGEAVTQGGEQEALLTLIVSTAATRLGADAATVALLDPAGQWLERVAHHNLGSALDVWTARISLRSGSAAEAIRSRKPAIVDNLEDDSRPHVRELLRAGFVSSITFPLLAHGRPIGVLTLLSRRRRSFSLDEQAIGLAFAGSAAITLENARLYREATASKEETQALAASSRELTESLNLDHVLGLTLRQTVLLAGADLAYMALTQPDGTARFVVGLGNQTRAFDWAFVRRGFGIAGLALATGEIQESADYLGDFSIWEGHAAAAAEKIRAVLVVPITLHGRTVGLLWVARRSVGQFSEQAKTRLQALAASAAIALENARLYKEIAQKNTELELANTTLADSVQVKTEFLANISHEIKTPIGSILGLLKLIMDGLCASPEEQQVFIAQAHASAQHLLRLVNDLLDMAQVESGSFRMDLEPVHLAGLFEELQAIVQVQADAKDLMLTFHPPGPAYAVIQADLKRLMQVLLNLVGNSLKFT
ncbi:MAG: GAF domain-containing protein, partial [Candidatus Methylomirabilia bacterium]